MTGVQTCALPISWTLPSNVCLTVNPKERYLKVKQDDEIYYVGKVLANAVLGEDYEILEEMSGKDLEHIEYEQLIPFINVEGRRFT